jgi:hypothetical protein
MKESLHDPGAERGVVPRSRIGLNRYFRKPVDSQGTAATITMPMAMDTR